MKDSFILNGEPTQKKILNGYTNFFGERVEGKFIKIDQWLKEKLK